MARELQPCGTPAAYQRHVRRGEQPCDACREANRTYWRQWADRTGYGRARYRAMRRLADLYPDIYRRLLREELAKEMAKAQSNSDDSSGRQP